MDDALTGAMTDITDKEWTVDIFTGISCREVTTFFSPLLPGSFNGFSADGYRVNDRLPDGLTDESNEVFTERNFPMNWTFGKFCPAIFIGIFTVKLADGWMDRMDGRHTHRWTDCQVESCLC